MSKYFKWGQTLDFGIKSETSLCRGECRRVMKLEVWPSELAFRFDSKDGKVRFFEYKGMQVDIQMVLKYMNYLYTKTKSQR